MLRLFTAFSFVIGGLALVALAFGPGSTRHAQAGSSDLVIDSFFLTPAEPVENQVLTITITVSNTGASTTSEYWIDFYSHLESPPALFEFGDDFCRMDPLGPSSSAICEVGTIYETPDSFNFWIQLDTENEVFESDENNNISGPNPVTVLADADSDGVGDPNDNCLDEPNPGQENLVHSDTPEGDACEDPDVDGVFDSEDNCPDLANPLQENTIHPATPAGDDCEDPDADALADAVDNCPDWPNPSQTPPDWNVPDGDLDCDGFSNDRETYLGTDPARQCPADTTNNNEDPDPWPVDMNDNRTANTLDVGVYVFTLNQSNPNHPGPNTNPSFNIRHDLNGNGTINTLDVGAYVFVLNKTCSVAGP